MKRIPSRFGGGQGGGSGTEPPQTRYARSGTVNIAYQVIGDGPRDLVFVSGWVSHLESGWAEPLVARFLRRLASFSRLILFDKRGTLDSNCHTAADTCAISAMPWSPPGPSVQTAST